MDAVPVTDGQISHRKILNRSVYVVYKKPADAYDDPDFPEVYEEEFRNKKLSIPTDGTKVVKMAYLAAERFLSQMPRHAPVQLDTGKWVHPPKALKIIEIEELKVDKEADKNACILCDFMALDASGLKRHITVKHPEHQNNA